jgi:hypothetical protein
LVVQSSELAASFEAARDELQERVARRMVERALGELDPPLDPPRDDGGLDALVDELDTSEDKRDFRRARAGMAEQFLRRGAFGDALYEALHARESVEAAVAEALDALRPP